MTVTESHKHSLPRGLVAQAGAVFALGAALWALCAFFPARMPAWMPWEFSWPEYLAFAFTLLWYARGLRMNATDAPAPWRRGAFCVGIGITYIVMQTHFDYLAQHMFFMNRIQHVVMHDLGPFLISLGTAGETIRRGMPAKLRRATESRAATLFMNIMQQPVLAVLLFVGLFYFWLIPAVHFRAMLDPRLYALMNWSMVLDGVLFWGIVLDPRPKPPARVSFGVRFVMDAIVMLPSMPFDAMISFSTRVLYPVYDLCGRVYQNIDSLNDQHIGGVIMWIPPAMMSMVGGIVILNHLRLQDERQEEKNDEPQMPVSSL